MKHTPPRGRAPAPDAACLTEIHPPARPPVPCQALFFFNGNFGVARGRAPDAACLTEIQPPARPPVPCKALFFLPGNFGAARGRAPDAPCLTEIHPACIIKCHPPHGAATRGFGYEIL